jgi:DNA replication protein DnaC
MVEGAVEPNRVVPVEPSDDPGPRCECSPSTTSRLKLEVRNVGHALLEGTFNHKLRTYVVPSVLVIEDVALIPMGRAEATAFYQVVNRRYEVGHSTIVATNRGLPS